MNSAHTKYPHEIQMNRTTTTKEAGVAVATTTTVTEVGAAVATTMFVIQPLCVLFSVWANQKNEIVYRIMQR